MCDDRSTRRNQNPPLSVTLICYSSLQSVVAKSGLVRPIPRFGMYGVLGLSTCGGATFGALSFKPYYSTSTLMDSSLTLN